MCLRIKVSVELHSLDTQFSLCSTRGSGAEPCCENSEFRLVTYDTSLLACTAKPFYHESCECSFKLTLALIPVA